jgi:hypothetical protein
MLELTDVIAALRFTVAPANEECQAIPMRNA